MIPTQEIETRLQTFLQCEVFAPEMAVTPETDLLAAGFDSMSLVRTLVFIETNYGLWIPEGEINAAALRSIRALAATVSRLLNER